MKPTLVLTAIDNTMLGGLGYATSHLRGLHLFWVSYGPVHSNWFLFQSDGIGLVQIKRTPTSVDNFSSYRTRFYLYFVEFL